MSRGLGDVYKRQGAHPERAVDSRIALTSDMLPAPLWRDVTRIKPDAGECEANPRARSAVMRTGVRTAAPWVPGGKGRL